MDFVKTLHSDICFIENVYWITDMTYDQDTLNAHLEHKDMGYGGLSADEGTGIVSSCD